MKPRIRGFTLVELVIVIVLMGIVGVVAFSRYMSRTAFNPVAAQDAIVSVTRTAQQASLGRNNVAFTIDAAGDEWVFTVAAGSTVLRSISVPGGDVVLETGSAVASGNTCANSYDTAVANDFELNFDAKGNLVDFTNDGSTEIVGAAFNGVRICVNDDVSRSVCVSPAGFAYEGNCDD